MQQNKKPIALEHFRKGCTWAEVAEAAGVDRVTLWRWSKSDPEFAQAIMEAKADPDDEVEAVTYQNACNPDPAHNVLRMFWLNARKGYKHQQQNSTEVQFVARANNPRDASNRLAPAGSNGTNGTAH